MPHRHYGRQAKKGIQEILEGLPLARKGLGGIGRRQRQGIERQKQERGFFRRQFEERKADMIRKAQQLRALERKGK